MTTWSRLLTRCIPAGRGTSIQIVGPLHAITINICIVHHHLQNEFWFTVYLPQGMQGKGATP